MEVLAHPDPFVLEHELLERVAAARAANPPAAVLIVVPTRRLADHVQRRLAVRLRACLGIHVLPYRALALRAVEHAAGRPRLLSARLRRALLEAALDDLPDNPWTAFVRRRPGALGGLLRALDDLREAGVSPAQATAGLTGGEREQALGAVYAAYTIGLDGCARRGWADEAGLVRAATRGIADLVANLRPRLVLHHGAYELIGIHLEMLVELDRRSALTFLLPAEPGAVATRYAERFARRYLVPGGGIQQLPERPGGVLGRRLAALYDEDAAPPPLASSVAWRHAQGAEAELTVAVRRAMAVTGQGVAPEEIAILARSLAPYADAIGSAFRDGEVPYSTSARLPLRRSPAVHDLLVLVRALADDLPRAATVEILRSSRVRWEALGEGRPYGDRADAWSREAKLLEGLEGWTRDLPEWAEVVSIPDDATDDQRARLEQESRWRREQAERIGRCLRGLVDRLEPRASRPWSGHADRLESVVREILPGCGGQASDPAIGALLEVVEEMRALDALLDSPGPVSFREMSHWLERAVDDTDLPAEEADLGGFRLLDVMQARGLTFRRVFVLGMNEGLFPRIAREDVFLGDAARRRLVERSGAPLPVREESEDEERQLLSAMLGAACDGLELSWQRSDETGRARTPSMALREVARAVLGTPDLGSLLASAQRLPSHPATWIASLHADTGLLTAEEERVWTAFRSTGPEAALAALGDRAAGLVPSLEMLCETEAFAPGSQRYDGRIGSWSPRRHSATSLECLGRCPLQYFFRYVLRVRELEEEASAYRIERRETGEQVHRLLEVVYRRLSEERRFGGDRDALVRRARALVPETWSAVSAFLERRFGERLPVLWRRHAARWLEAIEAFVAIDLEGMAREGRAPDRLERLELRRLDFGGGTRAEVAGRFDRTLGGEGGPVVGDYKTSGNLTVRAKVTPMLKGERLQVPLYWMMAGERGRVELLGVGPDFLPSATEEKDRRVVFTGFGGPREREGFLETVRVLLTLAEGGRFPLRADRHCSWCAYRAACRNHHPPTLEREAHARDAADYRDLRRKSQTRAPTLSDVRARGGRR